jgi:hypothetical protein
MRILKPTCLLAATLALLLGSGAVVDAKRPPRPKGGAWSGPTAQGFRIDFRVSRGKKPKTVAPLTADFRLRCSDGSSIERNLTTKDKAPVTRKRRKFAIVLTLLPNDLIKGGNAKFVGRFRSAKRARGRAREHLDLRDGRSCDSTSVRWKARFRRRH